MIWFFEFLRKDGACYFIFILFFMCICLYACDDMLFSTFVLDEWCILVILWGLFVMGNNSEELIICFYNSCFHINYSKFLNSSLVTLQGT